MQVCASRLPLSKIAPSRLRGTAANQFGHRNMRKHAAVISCHQQLSCAGIWQCLGRIAREEGGVLSGAHFRDLVPSLLVCQLPDH
jgi:hypothetical protein